jgi:G3E family GTPase
LFDVINDISPLSSSADSDSENSAQMLKDKRQDLNEDISKKKKKKKHKHHHHHHKHKKHSTTDKHERFVRSGVFMAVTMKNFVFWDLMSCGSRKSC